MRALSGSLLLVSVLALMPIVVGTALAEGMYTVDVAVNDRQPETASAAITDAFRQVLVRATGTVATLDNPALADAIRTADAYLLQYAYRDRSAVADVDPDSSARLFLNARFQAGQIESLLRRAGEALLPVSRPDTLLWMEVDDGNERSLVTPTSAPVAAAALGVGAARRALPIQWPLLDLEDLVAMPAQRARNLDIDAARVASTRYGAVSVAVGRIVQLGDGRWLAQWRHAVADTVSWDQAESDSRAGVAQAIVNALAEGVAAAFAVRSDPSAAATVLLTVDNIASVSAYRAASQRLRSLASVQGVQPVWMRGDAIQFRLVGDAGSEAIARELSLVREFRPADDAEADSDSQLNYHWEVTR